MKIFCSLFLLLMVLLAGCGHSNQGAPLSSQPLNTSGCFVDDKGSMFWGTLRDSQTTNILFVLLLPETSCAGAGTRSNSNAAHDFCNLTIKSNGHQWRIDGEMDWKTGIHYLHVSDLTANAVTNLNLNGSRFWRISAEKAITPLGKVDPSVIQKVLEAAKESPATKS